MRKTRCPGRENQERGVALVVALLAITVITGIGFALMISSSTETLIHSNFRDSGLALYAARGGLEEARGRMWGRAAAGIRIPLPADVDTAFYIRLSTAIDPTSDDCTFMGVSCSDPQAPAGTATALTSAQCATTTAPGVYLCPTAQTGTQVPYVWSKITLATQVKLNRNVVNPANAPTDDTTQVCFSSQTIVIAPASNPTCNPDGTPQLTPVFITTALAIEAGGSQRLIRQVSTYNQLPGLPAGLTLDGPNPTFRPGTSNNYFIDGRDDGDPPTNVPAVGTISDADAAAAIAGIPTPPAWRLTHYPGGDPPSSPNMQNVSSDMDSLYQSCSGLTTLLSTLEAAADYTYYTNRTSLPNPGTVASPVVNYVDGDLEITGDFSGAGILVVTGDLKFGGNSSYDGVIYVIGKGTYLQNGGGSGQYNGGIFIANTTPTCSTTGELGSPSYRVTGGGNNGIQYNSDLVQPPGGYLPVSLLSLNY